MRSLSDPRCDNTSFLPVKAFFQGINNSGSVALGGLDEKNDIAVP
jgi:hypothetical protein